MTELKDWLNSINQTKKNLIDEDPSVEKEYPPYIINKCFSVHLDTCLLYTSPSPRDRQKSRMPSSA